ncbi:hypothetical protein [Fuerstiella marisgermanici]|uniref:Uncharacterized protein n=1 Tax=Fuerstiella marisgermanici TaxID=1891926 RepID=A0A1P8WKA9_9PLAN|nr:hypothetical protein [Fuerstiella marisgermanici]APZ94507.1 hypothetical protein Fuma_04139 [Fuerstiella marisgermanici]
MTERRSLVEGVKESSKLTEKEEEFIYGEKKPSGPSFAAASVPRTAATPIVAAAPVLPQMTGRIPVTTRCRPEVASAIKRVSLQRQLAGVEPYTVQDIMEQALEQWLDLNGHA